MNTISNTPASSLQEETATANALLELLKQEQAQLIAANIDSLTALIQEKAKLIARMAELANNRYNALAAAGFEPEETGMKAWVDSTRTNAGKAWDQLLSVARTAKELNRINGLLISKHLANNQLSINVLHGGGGGQTFYGPNGQSSVKMSVRGLGVG